MKTKPSKDAKRIVELTHGFMGEAAQRQTKTTLNNYYSAISLFLTYLEQKENVNASTINCDSFCRDSVIRFRDWLMTEHGNAPQSANRRVSIIRTLVKYYAEHDVRFKRVIAELIIIRPLSEPHLLPKEALSKKAVEAIINATKSLKQQSTVEKYWLMIYLAYCIAARIDEVLSIRIRDLHLDGQKPYVSLIGKGRKIRTVPIPKDLVPKLRIRKKRMEGANPNPEFYLFSRINTPNEKLTEQGVNSKLKTIAYQAHKACPEVPMTLHFHEFRRARATHLLQSGVSLAIISEFLGHESVNTTMRYLGITLEMKAAAMENLLPKEFRSGKKKGTVMTLAKHIIG